MTVAWCGHFKFKSGPFVLAVVASGGIAFFKSCLAVPDSRYGHAVFSAAPLKTIQAIITLIVFAVFWVVYLNKPLRWNHAVGFCILVMAACVLFSCW